MLDSFQIFHKAPILEIRTDEEPRGIACCTTGTIKLKDVRVSQCLPDANFSYEQFPRRRFCKDLDSNRMASPTAFEDVREKSDANFLLAIDLVSDRTCQ